MKKTNAFLLFLKNLFYYYKIIYFFNEFDKKKRLLIKIIQFNFTNLLLKLFL